MDVRVGFVGLWTMGLRLEFFIDSRGGAEGVVSGYGIFGSKRSLQTRC